MGITRTTHSQLTRERLNGGNGISHDSYRPAKRKNRIPKRAKTIVVRSPRSFSPGSEPLKRAGSLGFVQISDAESNPPETHRDNEHARLDEVADGDTASSTSEFTGSLAYDLLLPILLVIRGGAVYSGYLACGAVSLATLLLVSELSLTPIADVFLADTNGGDQYQFIASAGLFAGLRLLLIPLVLAFFVLPVRAFFLNDQVPLGLLLANTPRAIRRSITTSCLLLLRVAVRLSIIYLTTQAATFLLEGLVAPSILNFTAVCSVLVYCASHLSLLCAPLVSIIGDYDGGYSLTFTPCILKEARSRIWVIVTCSVIGMAGCHAVLHGALSTVSVPSRHATLFAANAVAWLWFGVIALSSVVLSETYSFERRCYLGK